MSEKEEKDLLPKRKTIRLQGYDYSSGGGYFVTICCKDGAHRFGRVIPVGAPLVCAREFQPQLCVDILQGQETMRTQQGQGRQWSGADKRRPYRDHIQNGSEEPRPYTEWQVELNAFGRIVEEELHNIETRFVGVTVEGYVVMPNHVHFLMINDGETKHQLSLIVRSLKSIVTNRCMSICKDKGVWMEPLWQRNYYEHVIRGKEDHEQTLRYMYENPTRWGATH